EPALQPAAARWPMALETIGGYEPVVAGRYCRGVARRPAASGRPLHHVAALGGDFDGLTLREKVSPRITRIKTKDISSLVFYSCYSCETYPSYVTRITTTVALSVAPCKLARLTRRRATVSAE